MTTGPDEPTVQCYIPDGCCGFSPCNLSEDDFIAQVRALLPEGQLFNNTLMASVPRVYHAASFVVGCSCVGGEQLVAGGCCIEVIPCSEDPGAPQLAVVDSFAAGVFPVIEALCQLLRELDPCTAQYTLHRWAHRYGLPIDNPCQTNWSDETISTVLCIYAEIGQHKMSGPYLKQLAARFGADLEMKPAGDINCGEPAGWWTMARNQQPCPPVPFCPPEEAFALRPLLKLHSACAGTRLSLNVIISPTEVQNPGNCNLPVTDPVTPHDPELYEAFKWLLPHILPNNVYWCVYEADIANCIQ